MVHPTVATAGTTVLYKGKYYFVWAINDSGKCQMLNADGTKYSGTPAHEQLLLVKSHKELTYNGHTYYETKKGLISGSTGHIYSAHFTEQVYRFNYSTADV